VRRSARLTLCCGAASWQLVYGQDGMRRETTRSTGPAGEPEQPYVLSWGGGQRGRQPPPLALFLREELDAAGHSPEELAAWVTELDALEGPTRVKIPVPAPGGIGGVHWRAQRGLRLLLWAGGHARLEIPRSGPVWFVVDGLGGEAWATGNSFEEAVCAFDAHLDTVTVLPPPPEPSEEPLPEPQQESAEWTDEAGTKHVEMRATLRLVPKNLIPWPAPDKPNVPAAAFRLQWEPHLPAAWRAAGFDRVLPLVGEHGDTGWAWVRDEPRGALVVGRQIGAQLDPAQLEEEMARARAEGERERLQWPRPDWELDPSWVWHHWSFGLQRVGEQERLVLQAAGWERASTRERSSLRWSSRSCAGRSGGRRFKAPPS
jgi:hypothetical protein